MIPSARATGVAQTLIAADVRNPAACARGAWAAPTSARACYDETGRTLVAKRDRAGARSDFEKGSCGRLSGHRNRSWVTSIPAQAAALYTQAWNAGVTIGAFKLGQLYELWRKARCHAGLGVVSEGRGRL